MSVDSAPRGAIKITTPESLNRITKQKEELAFGLVAKCIHRLCAETDVKVNAPITRNTTAFPAGSRWHGSTKYNRENSNPTKVSRRAKGAYTASVYDTT